MVKVTVIVITYHPVWEKLKATILSVVSQQGVEFEIVFADDGSEENWKDRIESLLEATDVRYSFANSPENVGTVLNVSNGVDAAQGEYIKVISPGDFLYDSKTLSLWAAFMDENRSAVSFGDAVYYYREEDEVHIAETVPAPANAYLFDQPQDREKLFVNYLLVNDTILGASVMMRADVIRKYLDMIKGRVKYAEDYMMRIMVYDQIPMDHFRGPVIWYEYGLGISTSKEEKWSALLRNDYQMTDTIIKEQNTPPDRIAEKYLRFINSDTGNARLHKLKKASLFPSMVSLRKQMQKAKSITENVNTEYLRQLITDAGK